MNPEDIHRPTEEDIWSSRMERMCFRFLAEIPVTFIIRFVETKLGGKVLLNVEGTAYHCPGCSGAVDADDQGIDEMPCPGVEI